MNLLLNIKALGFFPPGHQWNVFNKFLKWLNGSNHLHCLFCKFVTYVKLPYPTL